MLEEGVPPVPAPLPARDSHKSEPSSFVDNDNDERDEHNEHFGLLAEPSQACVDAADDVVRLQSEVEALRLRREREEQLDWFRDREREQAELQQAEADDDAARAAEEHQNQRRRRALDRWLNYALAAVPGEAIGEVEITLHTRIKDLLAHLGPEECDDSITRRMVDGVVAAVLRPWNRQRGIEQVIEDAVGALPYMIGNWEDHARDAARAAVERLGPEASMYAVQNAAAGAVSEILKQYDAAKKAEADAYTRDRLIRWVRLDLRGYTQEGIELALAAVQDAWAKLPAGTSRQKLEEVRDAALEPWMAALAEREESLRTEAAARQKRQFEELQAQLQPKPVIIHRAPIIRRSPA
jgi:hypothetical protein